MSGSPPISMPDQPSSVRVEEASDAESEIATPGTISVPPLPSIVPSVQPVQRVDMHSVTPTDKSPLEVELVRQLRTGRAALPVLPEVAESALRLANDPEARIAELARLVDTDPPIAARFMSVANSVAYWRGMLTSSTQSAIVRLGLANTRDLLFQVVYSASASGLKKFQAAVHQSFRRSVIAAIAASTVARELGLPRDYDYMCGLLHNIGESRVYRILDGLSIPSDAGLEVKRLVKKYHCVAGAEIAMAWKLPTEIVDACAAHHDPGAIDNPNVRLVMIADQLVLASESVDRGAPLDPTPFERFGIDRDQAQSLLQKTRDGAEMRVSARP